MINFPSLSEECKRKYQQQLLCRYSRPCSPPAPSRRWGLEPVCKWGGMSDVSVLWRKPSQKGTSSLDCLCSSSTESARSVRPVSHTLAVCNYNPLHTCRRDIPLTGIAWGRNSKGLLRWPVPRLCRDLLSHTSTVRKPAGQTSKSSLYLSSISFYSFGRCGLPILTTIPKGTLSVNVCNGSSQLQLGLDRQSLTGWTQRGFDCLARTPLHLNFCLVARGSIFRVECVLIPRPHTHPARGYSCTTHTFVTARLVRHPNSKPVSPGTICPSSFPPLGYLGKSYLLITEGLLSAGIGVDTVTNKPMLRNIITRTLSRSSRFFWLKKHLHDSQRDKLTHGMSFLSTHLRGNQRSFYNLTVLFLDPTKKRTPVASARFKRSKTYFSRIHAGCFADTYLQKASCG